ncbi:hypothetical protein N658DRAFT_311873 [Parathielavia hyrcaniae]|uniref:Uncharacterized protein n=1 Tax=Parathielavia hyrcaniae TaxID=113614 RepID=A0AAN6PSX0_9PEZI|nr:hypothetical protein N658DRAFT_311873 [Parathielavia hyrcaniae]
MKLTAYATVLLGLVSASLAQVDPGPSPTESFGCVPHDDHWHCEGARETSAPPAAATTLPATSEPAVTTTTVTSSAHDDDDDDDDEEEEHTDHTAGTASLAPSPTESYGCEPHGDHWHCEGAVTALSTGSVTVTVTSSGADAITTTETSTSTSATASPTTAGAAHYEVAGLGFAGIAAIAAMAL